MRKAILSAAVLFFLAAPAVAQELTGGVKFGVNFANVNFEGDDVDVNLDSRTGLAVGGFAVWPVTPTFSFQPEALFSMKGTTFDEDDVDISIKLNYLDIPLLARYNPPATGTTSFHVFAGPSIGIKLSANAEGEVDGEDEEEDIGDEVKPLDFGLVIGAGVEFGRFTLDGRYTWGLTNINDAEDDPTDIKNRVFSILFGIKLGS